jgi:hypothetical protein
MPRKVLGQGKLSYRLISPNKQTLGIIADIFIENYLTMAVYLKSLTQYVTKFIISERIMSLITDANNSCLHLANHFRKYNTTTKGRK